MPLPATHEIHVFGSLNGIEFDMVGRGSGNPKDGSQELQVKSTKGSLPFSAQILIPHFGYGFYQYLPYPDGMSPFQAAMHDGKGYKVSRTMMFQDGAIMDAQYRYTYEGSHIKGEMQVVGTGFPADGPVMTKSLKAADWNVTKMVYPDNKTIRATYDWTYTTTSGKRYQSSVRTNHTFASPIAANILQQEPMFVFRKTELKGNAQDTEFTFRELQKAFSDLM
ncbi:PREDICTED: GFP-like non-fluorescent chromoprotein [Branchiostoma belcheri]|uniref:GFP-like non-fluorescent chromoprotein n=1 Tax=Branchiostoma belcheri TaxID=7741 RepID=A0A6P5AC37_BRABE|nr:PREDICTED: GFP-like non-fluorescent chromoprotein [Branchiostoma belcheri]